MTIIYPSWLPALFWVSMAAAASVLAKKMDVPGAITGVMIAMGMYMGGGYGHLGLIAIFFVLGVGASVWGRKRKQEMGLAQEAGGKRSVRHAFANGGMAGITGILAWLVPGWEVEGSVMMGAVMASALGDTWSSELGNLYGRRFIDLRTGKKGERGLDGIISLEGTLIGFVGSAIIAGYYGWMTGHIPQAGIIWAAGCLGNLADSGFGATLQRRGRLNNDQVNFLSTVVAALIGLGLLLVLNSSFAG